MPDTDFFKTKPFEHQSEALHVGWNLPEFGYFMEMGTGKSKVLWTSVIIKSKRCVLTS